MNTIELKDATRPNTFSGGEHKVTEVYKDGEYRGYFGEFGRWGYPIYCRTTWHGHKGDYNYGYTDTVPEAVRKLTGVTVPGLPLHQPTR